MMPNPPKDPCNENAGRFPLPDDFVESLTLPQKTMDAALVALIFQPWRELLEWLVHEGEFVDLSLDLLRGLLPLERALMRRPSMPKKIKAALDEAISEAERQTQLSRAEVFERWNAVIVPASLRPALDRIMAA